MLIKREIGLIEQNQITLDDINPGIDDFIQFSFYTDTD